MMSLHIQELATACHELDETVLDLDLSGVRDAQETAFMSETGMALATKAELRK